MSDDLASCICVCLERSTVMLDAATFNLPVVLHESCDNEFIDFSRLDLKPVRLKNFPNLPAGIISSKLYLLGSRKLAANHFREIFMFMI